MVAPAPSALSFSFIPARPRLRNGRRRADALPIIDDLMIVWDALAVIASGYLCATAYRTFVSPDAVGPEFTSIATSASLVGACLVPFTMRTRTSRLAERPGSSVEIVVHATMQVLRLMALVLAIGFLTRAVNYLPRLWMIGWSCSVLFTTTGGRLATVALVHRLERNGSLREAVAIVGATDLSARLLGHLHNEFSTGIDVVGVFDDGDPVTAVDGSTRSGSLDDLVRLCQMRRVDRAVIAADATDPQRVLNIIRRLKAVDVEITLCPPLIGTGLSSADVRPMAGLPLILLVPRPIRQWGTVMKLIEDRVLGTVLLIITLPVLAAIAIAIRLDSPGPILFRQKRHGWNNTEFDVLKFRTMVWEGPSAGGGAVQTVRHDPRVTRVGAVLRRTSLDELPQLFNVLLGEMSLVGPRPHPVVMRTENRLGSEIVAEYAHRHRVKPGITGWAQVNGCRGATDTAEQVRRRVQYDINYVENWSILFDLKILLMTPLKLLLDRANAF